MSERQPELDTEQGGFSSGSVDGIDRDVRRARLAQAAHFDALVDIRDAQTLRLVALHSELTEQVNRDPKLKSLLPLQLENGFPPRLWVDDISYVVMEPDPRTFRLTRQNATGHTTIVETRDLLEIAGKVREYASHRLIEQQRDMMDTGNGNSRMSSQIVMAWLIGFTCGVLVLLIAGILTGRISL
ncbi:MAG: hypothetical protein WBD37_12145 [Anderseniella sp.]